MGEIGGTLLKRISPLLVAVWVLMPFTSSLAQADVVGGSFVYVQESNGALIRYHVDPVDYQGTPAWRIAWDCEQIKAEHFIRRSDGAPLYVKRINHSLKRTVEISYSLDAKQPTIYRKKSQDEFLERKLWDKGLRDLGAMPQLLQGYVKRDGDEEVSFSAINYDDGKVYPLVAERSGYRNVTIEGERVRCAIYDVKLDSWLASFVGKTRLLIPQQTHNSNFVAYTGPGLDSGSEQWSIRLVGRDKAVAMLNRKLLDHSGSVQ